MRELHLLTAKRVLYVANVDEAGAAEGNAHLAAVKARAEAEGADVVVICADLESQIAELDDLEERNMFLEEAGISEPGLHRLIGTGYRLLGLKPTLPPVRRKFVPGPLKAAPAPPGGVIHTDFERGFIKAEVMSYDDFVSYGGEKDAEKWVNSGSKAKSTSFKTAT